MVSGKEIVDPGRRLPEFPIAGRDYSVADGIFFTAASETLVGFDPDAFLLIRVDLAPAFEASTAGAVALVFGALGNGTKIGDVIQAAISTVLAGEQGSLT